MSPTVGDRTGNQACPGRPGDPPEVIIMSVKTQAVPASPEFLSSVASAFALVALACAGLIAGGKAMAEPLGVELLTTSISANSVKLESTKPLDEIVVYGIRGSDEPAFGQRYMSDKLLIEIFRDAAMSRQLEEDFKSRVMVAELGSGPRQLRLGYDARATLVQQAYDHNRLPLDIIQPAMILNFSF
jgi:hypothetical protein